MKLKLSTLLLAVIISCPLAALAMESTPKSCPSIELIKKNPFNRAQQDYWLGWIAAAPTSKYDTEEEWLTAMVIGNIGVDEEQAIIDKANSFLPLLLVNTKGPEKTPEGWWCFYTDGTDSSPAMAYSYTSAHIDLGEMLAKVSARYQRLRK